MAKDERSVIDRPPDKPGRPGRPGAKPSARFDPSGQRETTGREVPPSPSLPIPGRRVKRKTGRAGGRQ